MMTTTHETGTEIVSLAGVAVKGNDEIKRSSSASRMRRRRSRRLQSRRSYSSSSYKNSGMFVY